MKYLRKYKIPENLVFDKDPGLDFIKYPEIGDIVKITGTQKIRSLLNHGDGPQPSLLHMEFIIEILQAPKYGNIQVLFLMFRKVGDDKFVEYKWSPGYYKTKSWVQKFPILQKNILTQDEKEQLEIYRAAKKFGL